jgi:hypothetical protein
MTRFETVSRHPGLSGEFARGGRRYAIPVYALVHIPSGLLHPIPTMIPGNATGGRGVVRRPVVAEGAQRGGVARIAPPRAAGPDIIA